MRIEIKDLNRIENQDNIVNKLCELDTRTFNAVFRASLKIRKANKILERNGALQCQTKNTINALNGLIHR